MTVSYDRLVSRPYIRILHGLQEHGPLRFNQIKTLTSLDDKTVDRILKAFVEEHFVYARALPAEGTRIPAQYVLAPRGKALLEVQLKAAQAARKHRDILGAKLVDEILTTA
ncbi:MAG TPA: hypothetical protein VGB18_07485 [Candidatus Thermoplasmatota archaeon]